MGLGKTIIWKGDRMLLGQRIKTLRKENNLTQEELGKLINVTKVSICCYEKETRIPTLETLVALANVFKVDINYFIGNDKYAVADNDKNYGMYVAKEELEFITEIRKYNSLHKKVIENPKRIVELIDLKMR